MSGAAGNAFLDLLLALAPAGMPDWLLVGLSALIAVAVGLALVAVNVGFGHALERRLAGLSVRGPRTWFGTGLGAQLGESPPDRGRFAFAPALALAGALGALAAYPFAPHVFFADLELGWFAIVALLFVSSLGRAWMDRAGGSSGAIRIVDAVPPVLALFAGLLIAGTSNLIAASRLQSDGFGLGWAVFKNPFALLAAALFLATAGHLRGDRICGSAETVTESTRKFLLCALAAVYFLGGFESPLTWALRQSLGEDPGFLNHVVSADGSTRTHIAIGGLVFQAACACTLLAKTWLGVAALCWLERNRERSRIAAALQRSSMTIGIVCVLGALLWEWARASLWSAG